MNCKRAQGRHDLARRETEVSDSSGQAPREPFPISRWLKMLARRAHERVDRLSATLPRRAVPASRLLVVLALSPAVSACRSDLSCSGADVQAALHQALDNLYAESRTLSRVDLTIKDIVSVGQTEHGVSCKAVVHLDINYLGIAKAADPIIPYTAERTDNGQVLVTADP